MKVSKKDFRKKLTDKGKELFDFTMKYGLPTDYFSRLLDISRMAYNNKLKGKTSFSKRELEIIESEKERFADVFKEVEEDVIDIYGKEKVWIFRT